MQNSPAFWSGDKLPKIYVRQGPNVVANCQNNVTIYVEIYGDTEGYKFQWEQVAGSPVGVVYSTPMNERTLSYTNNVPPGVRDDKRFRFWVNKGSSKQEYYDVNVFASPVELPKTQHDPISASIRSQTGIINQASNLSAWISMGLIYDYAQNRELSGLFLEWRGPLTNHVAENFIKFQPQKYVNGSWVDIFTPIVNHTGTYFIPLVEKNYNYRVVASYKALKKSTEIFNLISNVTWWVDDNIQINPHITYASDRVDFSGATNRSVLTSISTFSVKNQPMAENLIFDFKDQSVISNFKTFVNTNTIILENTQMLARQGNDQINSVLTIKVAGNVSIGTIGSIGG